ncbi:MAG: hypothetical protein HY852_11050 [Bradyrhizobium sp.]|uniref:hypothetical protein n=1 Tax=Bradyrhizobium sp. TaxID=376 RepID=UPI0025BCAE30|nr:hypothetical protein [Bradyrhizobium sp.]MBI5262339.1 hypothetical protein [Bradyrhizobium sp.]
MKFSNGYRWARLSTVAAALVLASVVTAAAQNVPAGEPQEADTESPATESNDADVLKDVDVDKLDWSQVNIDSSTFADGLSPKAKRAQRAAAGSETDWSSSTRPDGASAVTVKQSVSPFWDTRIGADLTVAREPTTMSEYLAQKVTNGGNVPQSSGTAWATMTAPGAASIWDKTALEARVDPAQDQSRLGTALTKSVPLSEQYSLTLQNGYNLTQQGGVPLPGLPGHTVRSYDTDQSAKVSITSTGTSFIAGQSLSSTDDKWLRKFGAEQKLLDGVTIAGSVGETAQGSTNKSVTAGFKRSW